MYYKNYFWKKGVPVGLQKIEYPDLEPNCFKIVSDPYKKHITIEYYVDGHYKDLIYDSLLLDFRHLNIQQQTGWQKETYHTTSDKIITLIRDMNDRVIFLEHHYFKDSLCFKCDVFSPHGLLTSVHKMHYVALQDTFNGVILYDRHEKPVMKKIYDVNPDNEFTTLLEETWDFSAIT